MAGVCFTYNSRQFLGQTVFIKRGKYQGKMGQVVRELDNDRYQVAFGEPGQRVGEGSSDNVVEFNRADFLIHRYRKVRVPVSRS